MNQSGGFSSTTPQYSAPVVAPQNHAVSGTHGVRPRGPPLSSGQSKYSAQNAPPGKSNTGKLFSPGYTSPDKNSGSPGSGGGTPENHVDPLYNDDGALELSVQAREFVPKFFAPSGPSRSDGLEGSSALNSSQTPGLLGLTSWGTGKGGASDVIAGNEDPAQSSLLFPSDLGEAVLKSNNNSIGFEGYQGWGLSDAIDIQMPTEGGGLGLPSALSGANLSNFERPVVDDELDIGAAILGSEILGTLDNSELHGRVSRPPRQSSSFLPNFPSSQDSAPESSGFSSVFDSGDVDNNRFMA